MNWLKKIASVTFRLEQSERIAQPKTISGLGNDLYTWAVKHAPSYYFPDQGRVMIESDGLDVDTFIGTINWYILKPEYSKDVPMYMSQWIREELLPHGIEAKVGKLERSRMYPDNLVQRLHILKNSTIEYPNVPEMNLNNKNAKMMFNVLGILKNPYQGVMDLQQLLALIHSVSDEAIEQFTRSDQTGGKMDMFGQEVEMGNNAFSPGINAQDIREYLQRLEGIVQYGLKNGFKKLVWN